MAESYIPQNTLAICTNMMTPMPQKLQKLAKKAYVLKHVNGEWQPVLNANDLKLSAAFTCKSPVSFLAGLEALCVGLAVAALVVATVATGGLAAVAVGVCIGACIGGVIAGGAALGYMLAPLVMNTCDGCLQKWLLPHEHVSVERAQALLQTSFLSCSNGGVITIVLDPVIAQVAAEKISDNNNKEVLWQMGKEFFDGFFVVAFTAATGGGALGIGVAAITAPIFYSIDENGNEEKRATALNQAFSTKTPIKQSSAIDQLKDNAKDFGTRDVPNEVAIGAIDATTITATTTQTSIATLTASEATAVSKGGITVASASEVSVVSASQRVTTTTLSTAGKTTATEATEVAAVSTSRTTTVMVSDAASEGLSVATAKSVTATSEESLEIAVKAGFKGTEFAKGLGKGLFWGAIGAVINYRVDDWFDNKKDALYKKTVDFQFDIWKNQSSNNKVIADRK